MANVAMPPTTPGAETSALPSRLWLDWSVVFPVSLILYAATCAPDVLMSDSGVYHLRVALFPPTPAKYMVDDLVQVHPLYLLLAKPFTWLPIGTIPFRVNLASAWFGAMALANVFASVRLLTGSRWAAVIGSLSVGLGHTFWAFSVIAECLTLAAACLTAELLFLTIFARTGRPRWFLAAALINGLSISNHMMGGLCTPVYTVLALMWWRRGRLRGQDLWAGAGLWVVGASPYLFIILRAVMETGQVVRILRSATTGTWPAAHFGIGLSLLGKVGAYLLLQYPTLLILLAIVALWTRPLHEAYHPLKWTVFGVAGMQFVFAARYPRPDQYSFFVPFYACVGIATGLGAWTVIKRWKAARWAGLLLALVPVAVYTVLPSAARRLELKLFTRELPYRDPYEFFLKPWRNGDDGVRRYAEELFRTLPKDAILFADPTPAGALFYLQAVEGKRPDLRIVFMWDNLPLDSLLKPNIPSFGPRWVRPVYAVDTRARYAPAAFIRDCRFVKEGIVYRVEPPDQWPPKPWM